MRIYLIDVPYNIDENIPIEKVHHLVTSCNVFHNEIGPTRGDTMYGVSIDSTSWTKMRWKERSFACENLNVIVNCWIRLGDFEEDSDTTT